MKKSFFVLFTIILVLALVSLSYAKTDDKWKDKLDSGLRKEIDSQSKGFSIMSAPEKSVDVIVATSDKNLERFGSVKKKFSIIQAVSMSVPASRLEQIARLDAVEKIEKEKIFYIQRLQAIPLIKADSATSDFEINGTNINISILDTGVYNHTEFQSPNRIILQYDFYNGGPIANDDNGHGTHVTGIAAGKGAVSYGRGVAANASIFAAKVCGASGTCLESAILSGIEWSVNNSAKIISMSLGGNTTDCSDAIVSAVDNATEQGVLVIVAAGNSGPNNNTIASPACAKRALAVGATYDKDYNGVGYSGGCTDSASSSKLDNITCFSSKGFTNDNRIKPDIMAPGSVITSTWNDGNYHDDAGTSQATPFVSGAAALVMEKYNRTFGYFPEPERVKAILLAAANTSGMEASGFANSGTPYRNNYYGSGRLDVYRALQTVNFTANNSVTQGQQKLLYLNITNSNASIVLVWGENSTTYNNLDLIVGNGTNNFTAGADKNDTVEHIFLRNVNNGTWNIYVNGTGVSGTQKYFISSDARIFSDAYPPQWSANSTAPNSPANYSKNGNYSFNITWTDDVAVDEVVFEWNFTSNYSYKNGNLSVYGSVFTANKTDLAVANYSFRWFANDTSGKWNSTNIWNYSVVRTAPNITVLLNSSSGNFTIASGDFVNITAYGGEGNISLYRNGSLVNNSLPPIYNITNYTGTAGTIFNITAFYNQTQNFTSQTATGFIKIDNTPPIFSNNKTYPAYPAPYGSAQFNITVFDETNISSVILEWNLTANYTASAFSGSGSYNTSKEFYQNISNISVGNHTYRWFANDSMNNWNSSQNFSYSIIPAASLSRLFLNGTEGNAVYTAGQIANITALVNISGKNITIFANFSGASQAIATATTSAENYTNTSNLNVSLVYNITSSFSGDENYTANMTTYYLGLCPASCPASTESACSGGSKTVTTYGCSASTNYQCQSSSQSQSCSSGTSSSSGGPSGTAAVTVSKAEPEIKVVSEKNTATISISSVQANSTQTINITDSLPINRIIISAAENSANARIEIRNISAPAAQKPEGEVFQYLSIEKTNITLNRADLEFFVTKKWVSDGTINISTISLSRLSGNWTRLATAKTGEDSANFYFRSSVPGFSYFAITGEKIQEIEENKTDGKQANAEAENKNSNMLFLVFAGVIILSASVIITYILKKRKLNGNKHEARHKR